MYFSGSMGVEWNRVSGGRDVRLYTGIWSLYTSLSSIFLSFTKRFVRRKIAGNTHKYYIQWSPHSQLLKNCLSFCVPRGKLGQKSPTIFLKLSCSLEEGWTLAHQQTIRLGDFLVINIHLRINSLTIHLFVIASLIKAFNWGHKYIMILNRYAFQSLSSNLTSSNF